MTCVAKKRACGLTANPLSNHQSPKILFPGPLIQPVNSSERRYKDPPGSWTHLLSLLQSDFGFHCFSVRFLFFVFFYWWIRVRHFHISHNAPYLPPPPPPPHKFCITFVFYFSWLPPPPPPPQILHNLCFLFLLVITAVPREIENNASAKFCGANKVHYR